MDDHNTTKAVQNYLRELADSSRNSNSEPLVAELLTRAINRLHLLCSTMLHRRFPRLERAPLYLESGDVLASVIMRLLKAVREVRPNDPRQFFALANQHMRWELTDMVRRVARQGVAAELQDCIAPQPAEISADSDADTTKILEAIESLPDAEREVLDLVRIQGMTHTEVAELLGVTTKTVQRRLNRSLILLMEKLPDFQAGKQAEKL